MINQYGYAGIAQFGRPAAREVGLQVGIAGSNSDERLDPSKAIPGAARLLNIKAKRLGEIAFSRYGQPDGIEFWKFVTAAYNGGEGTVALAMGHAYRIGLSQARAQGLVGVEAVSFARRYASKWENLKIGGADSPLGACRRQIFPESRRRRNFTKSEITRRRLWRASPENLSKLKVRKWLCESAKIISTVMKS